MRGLLGVLLVGLVAACASSAPAPSLSPSPSPTAIASPTPELDASFKACEEAVGPVLNALSEIDSRLSVGLNLMAYTTLVGDAKVQLDKLVEASTDGECSQVAVQAGLSVVGHMAALDAWSKCVRFPRVCTREGGMDQQVQPLWAEAGKALALAKDALEGLRVAP